MSNAQLPALPGLSWGVKRAVQWSTQVKTSVSGREYRAANFSYPRYQWSLDYEFLRDNATEDDVTTLLAFINARSGSLDNFIFADPIDAAAVDTVFGVGDGTTFDWRLTRNRGGYVEPVFAYTGTPTIKKAGVVQSSGVTVSDTGLVSFDTEPTAGQSLTWSGQPAWRVRFNKDGQEFNQFMENFHDLKGLGFISVKATDLVSPYASDYFAGAYA